MPKPEFNKATYDESWRYITDLEAKLAAARVDAEALAVILATAAPHSDKVDDRDYRAWWAKQRDALAHHNSLKTGEVSDEQ